MKADTHDPAQAHEHDHGHQAVPSDLTLRVKALESLLVEKGLVDPAALDALIDSFEHKIGPRNGARVVARAWVDPDYKERLLTDATAAIGELGYTGAQGEHMMVVVNGPKVHNLVCFCGGVPTQDDEVVGEVDDARSALLRAHCERRSGYNREG
ncbi:MAG: nitrile hydratase subunit alpha [Verrucomicrobia bacterium]|nr:nitrile hydratase subunit alpha [Verrucomicrobiota bacterium]